MFIFHIFSKPLIKRFVDLNQLLYMFVQSRDTIGCASLRTSAISGDMVVVSANVTVAHLTGHLFFVHLVGAAAAAAVLLLGNDDVSRNRRRTTSTPPAFFGTNPSECRRNRSRRPGHRSINVIRQSSLLYRSLPFFSSQYLPSTAICFTQLQKYTVCNF